MALSASSVISCSSICHSVCPASPSALKQKTMLARAKNQLLIFVVVGKCALAVETWEGSGILGSTADLQLLRHIEQAILIFILVLSLLHCYGQALGSEAKNNTKKSRLRFWNCFLLFYVSSEKKPNMSRSFNIIFRA